MFLKMSIFPAFLTRSHSNFRSLIWYMSAKVTEGDSEDFGLCTTNSSFKGDFNMSNGIRANAKHAGTAPVFINKDCSNTALPLA